jgi:hypothetical protein
MRREDVLAFARRDWAAVGEAKAAFWAERKASLSPNQVLALGDALRRHARSLKPDWPDAAEGAEDLAVHRRVSEALRAVRRQLAR